MSAPGFTPGPWSFGWEGETRDWAIVTDAAHGIVANVNTETGPDAHSVPVPRQMPAEANARTISAVPELYEAARLGEEYDKLLRRYAGPLDVLVQGDVSAIDEAYDKWRNACAAALAKARGQ